ncbi:MAG: site-specific integrase [Acidimicrobiales bacterium]
MKGFMRKRGDAWELRVFLGADAVTGKKRYATRTVRGGKRDAERELAKMVYEADAGHVARTDSTVGQLLDAWLAQASRDFSPKTVLETRGFIERTIKPGLGSIKLAKLRTADIDRFYVRLQGPGGGIRGAGLAPGTIRRIHGILRRALEQAVRWGWLAANPASRCSPPRVPSANLALPAPGDVAKLFAMAQQRDPELALFVMVAAATGARRSEVIALRWLDLDLEAGAVTIGRGVVLGPDGLVEKDTKTHATRRISLDPTTVEQLRLHRRRVDERARLCAMTVHTNGFVFSGDIAGNECWRPDSTSRAFRRLCRQAGFTDVRLHDLRHYVATRLLTAGVDVRTVAGRLGHRNAATTLNVYAQFVVEADRDAANLLGRLFDDAAEGLEPDGVPRPEAG